MLCRGVQQLVESTGFQVKPVVRQETQSPLLHGDFLHEMSCRQLEQQFPLLSFKHWGMYYNAIFRKAVG